MALSPGTRLGPYEIQSALGAGGMGEVYKARDTKLNRDVAIKILLPAVASDPERLARFRREAQVLASLNHPHIGAIYGLEDSPSTGSGQAGDVFGLVMELVDGPTLADRIAQSAIPLHEALTIAAQIADALEAAHEQGIVHRDLKPANIKVRDDGTVKVLDFGLAKALEPTAAASLGAANSPTITTPAMMTGIGVILGTAAYMSPEQAKGRAADKRSDVWSFGAVLYEMLTGRRAFEGEDVSDTLANVLKIDPDWTALPGDVPASIQTLVRRCLAKDRRQRIADMSVVRFVLAEPASVAPPPSALASVVAAPTPGPRWKSALPVAVVVLLAATLAALAAWRFKPSNPAPMVARFSFTLPESQQLTASSRLYVAISPEGTHIAYIANNRLFLRSLDEFEAHAIPGTDGEGIIDSPAFSPDGRSLAFHSQRDSTIKRITVNGGAPVTVCPSFALPLGMTWDPSGIVFGTVSGIVRCSTIGGAPEQLAKVADGEIVQGPQLLLDGSVLLFTVAKFADGPARWDKAQIVVQDVSTGARKTLVNGGTDARYLSSGHLVYAVGGIVFAQPFNPARQELTGSAVPVVEGVKRPLSGTSGAVQFAISRTGTLLYVPGSTGTATRERALAMADRAGTLTRLAVPSGPYVHVRASRDGARLAIGVDNGAEASVSIQELRGTSAMRRLTFGGQNRFPIWSPDGQHVAFQSDREGDLGIFSQRADGNGPVERLTKAANGDAHVPESWSPDGRHVSLSVVNKSVFSLWMLSTDDKKVAPFGGVESHEFIGSVFSPDGRWIAYTFNPNPPGSGSAGSGANRGVYIQPFPASGERWQIPRQQIDFHPAWGPKGTELFFVPTAASGRLAAVSVTTQPSVIFGSAASLAARVTANRINNEMRAWDVLPDGRFVGLVDPSETESPAGPASSQMRVVLNWSEELKQRVPMR